MGRERGLLPRSGCRPRASHGLRLERHLQPRNGHRRFVRPCLESRCRPQFVSADNCGLLCRGVPRAVYVSRDVLFEGFSTPSRTPHCCSGGSRYRLFQLSISSARPVELAPSLRLAPTPRRDGALRARRCRRTLQRRGRGFPALGSASSALILPPRHFLLVCSLLFYCAANRRGWKSSVLRSLRSSARAIPRRRRFLSPAASYGTAPSRTCGSFHSQSRHALALCVRRLSTSAPINRFNDCRWIAPRQNIANVPPRHNRASLAYGKQMVNRAGLEPATR